MTKDTVSLQCAEKGVGPVPNLRGLRDFIPDVAQRRRLVRELFRLELFVQEALEAAVEEVVRVHTPRLRVEEVRVEELREPHNGRHGVRTEKASELSLGLVTTAMKNFQ